MGSEGPLGGGTVTLDGRVHGTGELDRVEAARFDSRGWAVVYTGAPEGTDHVFRATDPEARPGSFYYLRVRQDDDDRGWSTPIGFD